MEQDSVNRIAGVAAGLLMMITASASDLSDLPNSFEDLVVEHSNPSASGNQPSAN